MHFEFTGLSLIGILVAVSASIAVSELMGYLLHRLMHSERFPVLSRAHMIHHLYLYGPDQAMRAPEYKNATNGRFSLGNVGMEWLLPSATILALSWLFLWVFGVPPYYQLIVLSTLLAWPLFMFSYLHDRMYLENFWMERTPILNIWFKKARRLHDVHHRSLSDEGRMNRNFGIGLFFFDRVFGTLAKRHCPLNWKGYGAAMSRHRLHSTTEDDFSDFPSSYRV